MLLAKHQKCVLDSVMSFVGITVQQAQCEPHQWGFELTQSLQNPLPLILWTPVRTLHRLFL
jgi:hypothetical protein